MRVSATNGRFIRLCAASAIVGLAVSHDGAHRLRAQSQAAATFDRLKSLVGSWEAKRDDGSTAITRYEIASSALVEHYQHPGEKTYTDMTTMYYLDGDRLMLTHYCVSNQPTMAAAPAGDPKEVRFRFVSGTNLPTPDAGHMHEAVFRFIDANHFSTAWTWYDKGKPAFTETLEYVRK